MFSDYVEAAEKVFISVCKLNALGVSFSVAPGSVGYVDEEAESGTGGSWVEKNSDRKQSCIFVISYLSKVPLREVKK